MSLILEALKKSEAERRVGQPPGLLSQVPSASPARRSVLPWAALLLVPVLVAAAWWFGRASAPLLPVEAEPAEVATIEQPPAPVAPQQDPQPAVVAAPPSAPPRPPARPAAALREAPPSTSPEASGERESAPMSAAEGELMLPSLPAPLPAPDALRPAVEAMPAEAASIAPPEPVTSELPIGPAQADVPELRDFDVALRAELPPLRASMHVYDADPARRFVLIDGRRVGEGDVLGESLFLIEIRRDGSVLEFRGQRFLLPRPG